MEYTNFQQGSLRFFISLGFRSGSQDSAVGVADRSSKPGRVFSPLHVVQTGSGTRPGSYPADIGPLSTGVKRPVRKTDQSTPTNAKVKNTWTYKSNPPYVFIAICLLIKHRDNFYFFYKVSWRNCRWTNNLLQS
jgi:hypothetical protein